MDPGSRELRSLGRDDAFLVEPSVHSIEALMDCQLDVFFLEAILNGLLLAGLLALLALGLNLVFGVIDVVWICYAELVMVGMYGIHFGYKAGLPFLLAAIIGIILVAIAGAILHYVVIRPVLDSAPINQLLVTGGVLFFLQAAATMAFGIDFKTLGIRLGSVNVADMSFAWSRILAFGVALAGMLALWLFLSRTFLGTAIRAIAQDRQIMPLMGVDSRRIYLVTSAIGGGLAGLAAALMVLQYDIYPQIGLQFGPLIFMICVLGGLGNMIGGFVAAFIISEFIAVGGSCFATEWGYAVAFLFFMVVIFIRPQGLFGSRA
jgi:branched-chain amino acid transport system permease protein